MNINIKMRIVTISEEQIEEAKQKSGLKKLQIIELYMDDDKEFEGLFRKPSNESITRFSTRQREMLAGGKGDLLKTNATFVMDNMLLPEKEPFQNYLEEYPLLATSIVGELVSGQGIAKDAKKKQV